MFKGSQNNTAVKLKHKAQWRVFLKELSYYVFKQSYAIKKLEYFFIINTIADANLIHSNGYYN